MLTEAFKFLFDAGRNSAPAVFKVPGEPDHIYMLRRAGGELERKEAQPAPARHTALSLQAIVALAEREDESEAWYSTSAVQLLFGEDRRAVANLPLILSEQVKQLIDWREKRQALGQPELIRVLRTTFRDAMASAGTLLEVLKKVKFNTSSVVNAEVGHGKASIGKEIMGEVTGVGAIPEYVTFSIPLFANACFRSIRATVECALDPDAGSGQFRVIPLPGQIEAAIDAGNAAIGTSLRESLPKSVPLYYGTP